MSVSCLDYVKVNSTWPFLQQFGVVYFHVWPLADYYCLLRLRMEKPVSLKRVCQDFPNGVVK